MSSKEKAERTFRRIEMFSAVFFTIFIGFVVGCYSGIDPIISILGFCGIAIMIWRYVATRDERRINKQVRRELKTFQKMDDPIAELEAITRQKRENHE